MKAPAPYDINLYLPLQCQDQHYRHTNPMVYRAKKYMYTSVGCHFEDCLWCCTCRVVGIKKTSVYICMHTSCGLLSAKSLMLPWNITKQQSKDCFSDISKYWQILWCYYNNLRILLSRILCVLPVLCNTSTASRLLIL